MHKRRGQRRPVTLQIGGVVEALVLSASGREEGGRIGVPHALANVPDVEVRVEDLDQRGPQCSLTRQLAHHARCSGQRGANPGASQVLANAAL